MRNIKLLFEKINSFEIVTLHTSGMRYIADHEIVNNGDNAIVSQYAIEHRDGEKVRHLQKRAKCSMKFMLELMNKCRLLSWDGFYGKHPKGIKDGIMFSFDATINDKKIHADGSQNFPSHYRDFTDGIYKILQEGENERI